MSDCIFCQIVSGDIPADIVYEDDEIIAFRDLSPQAPTHALVIPRRHIESMDAVTATAEDMKLMGHMLAKIPCIADTLALDNGYRLVINCGEDGYQTVMHLHIHLLGGRHMHWPPG